MSSSTSYEENENWSAPAPVRVQKHDILCNKSIQYLVLDFTGEGCFGKVAKCINFKTAETTAIKIHQDIEDHDIEVKMLEQLRTLDPEKNNLVTFRDSFIFQDMPCVAFEMLDRSLWDLVVQGQAPLTLNEIRPIARQLLVAFEALKSIGILHTDLKPDNVMLINHKHEPFRVKLIDFGLAIPASKVKEGMIMQPCAYRAPEVNLGLPISEAIDMWGLGCVLAFLYFAQNIFPGQSTYNTMRTVCHLIGQPGDYLLNAGKNTWQFFKREHFAPNSSWRLKTPKEYKEATGIQPQTSKWTFDSVGHLDEVVKSCSNAKDSIECEDMMAFSNLLQWLLFPDAEMRFTPGQALKHDFVTMCHLFEYMDTSTYVQTAHELMVVSPPCNSDEYDKSLIDFKSDMESNDSRDRFWSTHSSWNEDADPIGYNCDPPTPHKPCRVQKHDILCNKSIQYLVLDFFGEGCFGKVAKCINIKTAEFTAIKIHQDIEDHDIEVKMLEQLRTLDPEKNNLVTFRDSFIFQDMPCVAFEMLDRSLWDLVVQGQAPLTLNEIRPIARQLLVAFEALKSIGILHTDLKPDNVMLVNHKHEPFRVKLIDFGLAIPASKVKEGMIMQPCAYRAPEVNLGLPISEAIDMWGLGCVLAFLYFAQNIFPGQSTYNTMRTVCHLIGQPGDYLLNAGKNTWQFFKREHCSPNSRWRLKTPKEYKEATGIQPQTSKWTFDSVGDLDEVVKSCSKARDSIEYEDMMAFSNLLQWLLLPDAEIRVTPGQALKHDFVTMCHLFDYMDTSTYVQTAHELMVVSPRIIQMNMTNLSSSLDNQRTIR